MSIESVMPSSHLILCHPLLFLPSIFPSISVFSNESVLCINGQSMGASASASASVLPMDIQDLFPLGLTGLISLRMDWIDFLAVQGILKSLFQHHSSKPSIIRCSAFFMVQFAHPYTTTGKTTVCTERLPNVMLTFLCPPALGSSCRTKLQNQGEAGAGRGAKRMP